MKKVLQLVEDEFSPAMYLLADVLTAGELLPADRNRARELISRAALKNFGPALYRVGWQYLEGKPGPQVVAKGREMIDRAANLGSVQAQYFLGSTYERPNPEFGYEHDLKRSQHYFRLCAAAGLAQCQMRLGKSLLARDTEQAIAWLELAADQGDPRSVDLLREERDKLTPEQTRRVNSLKKQLLLRQ